jgi:hypothetical protein
VVGSSSYVQTPDIRSYRQSPAIECFTKYGPPICRDQQCSQLLIHSTCRECLVLVPKGKTRSRPAASGCLSRNNSDPTAPSILCFMGEAGIDRSPICLWNLIPGWNGTIKVETSESKNGTKALGELLSLLPYLESVVLVGKKTQEAQPFLKNEIFGLFPRFIRRQRFAPVLLTSGLRYRMYGPRCSRPECCCPRDVSNFRTMRVLPESCPRNQSWLHSISSRLLPTVLPKKRRATSS